MRLLTMSRAHPGWAHPKAALALDFFGNRAWRAGAGVLPLPSAVATVRASDAWQKDASGVYRKFGPNALPCLPGIGAAIHAQYTQYFADPAAPATQTVPLAAGTYTCRVAGAGSVTLSGAASGVAIDGAPVKFTLAASGNVTCTVAGNPACVNLTNTAYPAPMHLAAGTRLGSDVRAIASGSEPFAGWSAAGLGDGHGIFLDADITHIGDVVQRHFCYSGYPGDAANLRRVYIAADDTITAQIFNTATGQNTLITAAKAVPGRLKIAVRWAPGAHRIVANNGGSGTSVTATALEARPSLMIGGNQSGQSNLNDTLRSLTVLRAPSDAEMDAWVAS